MAKVKRLILCLLSIAVLLSAFASTIASAANGKYRIEEAKLEVTIPKTYTVITRNTPSNTEVFARLGLSCSALMSNMKSGSVDSRQESVMKTAVDSVKYDTALPVAPEGKDADSFVYTDGDSGVEFTVPKNWKQKDFTEDREYLSAKFVSTKEDGCTILFSALDIWNELSPSEKIGLSRAGVDNSIVTKADIAEMFSTTEDDISLVTYNGVDYYKCTLTANKEEYGLSLDITTTQLLCVNNGWMYSFQFNGKEDHKLYPDFEELVKSVQYPLGEIFENDDNAIPSYTADTEYDNSQFSDNNFGSTVLGVILIIVVIVAAVFLIKRISKFNRPSGTFATVYCRKCGQVLPYDSDFCHICGTKVEREN